MNYLLSGESMSSISSTAMLQTSAGKSGKCRLSNEEVEKNAKKGDIIFVSRFGFWHYGVSKNRNYVIHLSGYTWRNRCMCQEIVPELETKMCRKCHKKIAYSVQVGNFWDFVCKGKAHILPDGERSALQPDDIVEKAESMIGLAAYNLKFANCEHFATMCRYGLGFSTQTKTKDTVYMGTSWTTNLEEARLMQSQSVDPTAALTDLSIGNHGEFLVQNEATLKYLELGDNVLVCRPRSGYWHYGVFVGNEYIIHLTKFNWPDPCNCQKLEVDSPNPSYCKKCRKKLTYFVRMSTFVDFAAKGKAHKVPDGGRRPLKPDEIIRKAKSMIGPAVYDQQNANCEHFATMCRYGFGFSTQTKVCDIDYKGTSWEKMVPGKKK